MDIFFISVPVGIILLVIIIAPVFMRGSSNK